MGTVTQDGNPLPGVTVTAASPALQGTRTAVTNESGAYLLAGLPPGEYTLRFELQGLQTATRRQRVGVAQTARVDASLQVTAVAEAITVTASAPAVAETTEVQTNFTQQEIEELPIGRTIAAITGLAPGVVSGVNGLSISGSLSYDNVYLVDGVNIQENLRGQTHTLFIEDAIQETTVQTAGISAEYGNFTGGVVNAITKSGGNEFSGSLRDSLTNEAWTEPSPDIWVLSGGVPTRRQNPENLDKIDHVYEATLGGRILRDRLWFFLAGRYNNRTFTNSFSNQNKTFERGDKDERMEVKLTGAVTPRHNIVASYLEAPRTRTNDCQLGCIDMTSVDPTNSLPLEYTTLFYNGVITNNFLVEAKWADKNFEFLGTGGEDTNLITGTPIRFVAPGWGTVGNEPYFGGAGRHSDARNSDQISLKGTYFLGTQSLGSHNIVFGAERWHEERRSNNYQSPTDYVWFLRGRAPTFDANGNVLVNIVPNSDILLHFPIALQSQGSDLNTDGIYVNDKWDFNQHVQFNLGVRYDANDSSDSSGNPTADDSAFSPRLGAIFDLFGNGRVRLNASYGQYVGRLADTVAGAGSAAGSPATVQYLYRGPAVVNLPYEEAMRIAFGWFNEDRNRTPDAQSIPGFNTRLAGTLVSPNVREWTVGASTQVGPRGYVRADYIDRDWRDFYGTTANLGIGSVTNQLGQRADLFLVGNTNDLERKYKAIQLQGGFRPWNRLDLGANYTWSELRGNVVGETSGSGPVTEATRDYYPEYFSYDWNNPVGFLGQDQTHKLRAWAALDIPTFLGNFNVSVLQRFDSGGPYSLAGTIDIRENANFYGAGKAGGVKNPGYVAPPTAVTYYFSERGEFRFDDLTATDLALNYGTGPGWLGGAQLFIQAEVVNAFNEDALIAHNTSVLTHLNNPASCATNPSGAGCLQRFNPKAGDTPVEGVHWRKGPLFGLPTNAVTPAAGSPHYQLPRTYRFSAGIRF